MDKDKKELLDLYNKGKLRMLYTSRDGVQQGINQTDTATKSVNKVDVPTFSKDELNKIGDETNKSGHGFAVKIGDDETPVVNNKQNSGQPTSAEKTQGNTPEQSESGDIYTRMLESMMPKPTAQDELRRQRRERTNAIIRAIGDGVSAMSNIYFARKGAPNARNAENDLTKSWLARQDYEEGLRQRNRQLYTNAYLQARKLDESRNQMREKAEEAKRHNAEMERIYAERNESSAQNADTKAKAEERLQRATDAKIVRDAEKFSEQQKQNAIRNKQADRKIDIMQQNANTSRQNANTRSYNAHKSTSKGAKAGKKAKNNVQRKSVSGVKPLGSQVGKALSI